MSRLFLLLFSILQLFTQYNDPYILVLGIAQDAGYPQINCQKELCQRTHLQANLKRYVSCLAIVDPQAKQFWIIDATPDITEQLKLAQLESGIEAIPNGIFLTHAHIGHYTGLMYFGREVMGTKDLPVYAMPRMQSYLESNGPWDQLLKLNNIKIEQLENKKSIKLNERISIVPFLVPHRDEYSETVGYKIIGPKKSVIFIPDINKWSIWQESIIQIIKENDLAFLDGSFYDQNELPGRDMAEIPHPLIVESIKMFESLSKEDRSKISFIHFNHSNYLLDPNSEQTNTVMKLGFKLAEQGSKIRL